MPNSRTGGLVLGSNHVAFFDDGRGRGFETSLLLFRCFRFDRSMMEVVAGSKPVSCCSVVFVSNAALTWSLLLFVRWVDDPTMHVSMMYAKQLSNDIIIECYTQ